jgi:hypothetical protein
MVKEPDVSEPDLPDGPQPAAVEQLQEVRPINAMQGHEVCADIHTALSVAEIVLASRDYRVAHFADSDSSGGLIRELRALGVVEAAPQLIAMVALVDVAVERIADLGAMSETDAWEKIRKDLLSKHCQGPDPS